MKRVILAVLFSVALVPASNAFAALDITSLTVSPATTTPNSGVVVDVTVSRTPNTVTVENDWLSTKYSLNGSDFCVNNPNNAFFTQGSGVATSSATTTAPSTDGSYPLVVNVYRNANCATLRDTATTSLGVVTPPTPTPTPTPAPEQQRHRGGDRSRCVEVVKSAAYPDGLYCPNEQARIAYNEMKGFGSTNTLWQQIQIQIQILKLKIQILSMGGTI